MKSPRNYRNIWSILITLLLVTINCNAQTEDTKRSNFDLIPAIQGFNQGIQEGMPGLKKELKNGLYTKESIQSLGGKKNVKKIIKAFVNRFDGQYFTDKFYSQIKDNYTAEEFSCLQSGNCSQNEAAERWATDLGGFFANTSKDAEEYTVKLLEEIIKEIAK